MSYCKHSDREGQRGGAAGMSPNEIQWSSGCSPIPLGRAPILFRRDLPVHGAALLSQASSPSDPPPLRFAAVAGKGDHHDQPPGWMVVAGSVPQSVMCTVTDLSGLKVNPPPFLPPPFTGKIPHQQP